RGEGTPPRLFLQHDAERRSLAQFRMPDKKLPLMILLDNALREAEPQTPATLLGGESRLEHLLQLAAGDALARVRDVDQYSLLPFCDDNCNSALSFHGVQCIFEQVFYY